MNLLNSSSYNQSMHPVDKSNENFFFISKIYKNLENLITKTLLTFVKVNNIMKDCILCFSDSTSSTEFPR